MGSPTEPPAEQPSASAQDFAEARLEEFLSYLPTEPMPWQLDLLRLAFNPDVQFVTALTGMSRAQQYGKHRLTQWLWDAGEMGLIHIHMAEPDGMVCLGKEPPCELPRRLQRGPAMSAALAAFDESAGFPNLTRST